MPSQTGQVLLASTQSAVGWVIFTIILLGFFAYLFVNLRSARPEVGSEVELAPNRKPYLPDEELEGRKLDRALGFALVLLTVIGVALPLYWLYEPARQVGAEEGEQDKFVSRGERIYDEGANCAACHGPEGVGGVASYTISNADGEFVKQVDWKAPALNTVLYRYSEAEVLEILTYGRKNTPMPAWGVDGGGPLTTQQLDNLVDYLESVQLTPEELREELDAEIEDACAPDDDGFCTSEAAEEEGWETLGEALFNLGYRSGFQGGGFSCGRCHTRGWSYGEAGPTGGGGSIGFNLRDGATLRQFPTAAGQVEFITAGGERGQPYGTTGQSANGYMPGFGLNPNAEEEGSLMTDAHVMYSPDEIEAIVDFERTL
jgi:mono/diheme cytochrome c family protein